MLYTLLKKKKKKRRKKEHLLDLVLVRSELVYMFSTNGGHETGVRVRDKEKEKTNVTHFYKISKGKSSKKKVCSEQFQNN